MPKPPDFSVLVIGAGPSGCAFALQCAAAGLKVGLIEAQRLPRARPGETLHPGIEPIFKRLGMLERVLAAGFHRHSGIWVEWEDSRRFHPYGRDAVGQWLGFQADRARLDDLLLDAARDAGVEVIRPCKATGLLHAAYGSVEGVTTTAGDLRGKWIADASGRSSWLARQMGLRIERHSPPFRARFGWTEGCLAELNGHPLLQACPGGWDWWAPLGQNKCAWVKLRISLSGVESAQHDLEAGSGNPATLSGSNLDWRLVPASAGSGYFLLGDAAASLDPSSSHGVLRSLMSGMFASHVLTAAENGSISPQSAASAYRDWLHGQFHHDVSSLRELWKIHPHEPTRIAFDAGSSTEEQLRSPQWSAQTPPTKNQQFVENEAFA